MYKKGKDLEKAKIREMVKLANAKPPIVRAIKVRYRHLNTATLKTFLKNAEIKVIKRKEKFIEERIPGIIEAATYLRELKALDYKYRCWFNARARKEKKMVSGKYESYHPNCKMCPSCGTPRIIYARKICRLCYAILIRDSNDAKRAAGERARGRPARRRVTGEAQLFRKIWDERCDGHYCEECGVGLFYFSVANFHHRIPKSKRPDLRLDAANIGIVCLACHAKHHS